MKLLSLGTPYIPYAPVHNQVLVQQGSTDMGLNRHKRGLPPWSPKFTVSTTLILPIQYSPLSSNCSVRSLIMPTFLIILLNPHRTSINRKGPYREWIPATPMLLIAYTTKHSILSLSFFHRGKQSGPVRVFLVQLGFH
jgi:hypothetical protein